MPRYPIYIPSKGRWRNPLTIKMLAVDNTPFRVVVQPQDYDRYLTILNQEQILLLPFDDEERGLLRARNWIWEHAINEGSKRHWQLDDNIRCIYRWDGRVRVRADPGKIIEQMEDFVDRYANVAQAGPNYDAFPNAGSLTLPHNRPFKLNTRIYSFTLNLNELPFRYRAAYNDDTDLSLQCLKARWCTILFLAFTCDKATTMTMRGGNTDKLYRQDGRFDGRLEMAKSLVKQHPDVTKIVWKWGRWQHHVDYRPFRHNKLRRA